MTQFLHTTRIALTPLSPIHIGSGEDFEPTNYVIENGVLYGFDPSRANLPENLQKDLGRLGLNADLLGIQNFFITNKKFFTACAKTLIPVVRGLANDYVNKIGKPQQTSANGNRVVNQLFIQRTFVNSHMDAPVIPGSSFKGALRTTILDRLNNRNPALSNESRDESGGGLVMENRILKIEKSEFSVSPFRLFKVADLMPSYDVARQVVFAINRKKKSTIDSKSGLEKVGGPSTRNEVISHGQYRAFSSEISLYDIDDVTPSLLDGMAPHVSRRLNDLRAIAIDSNNYYFDLLTSELRMLASRGFANPEWIKQIQDLLDGDLKLRMQKGDVFLVRLGRYTGAESKTIDGMRRIKIPQEKDVAKRYVTTSYTVWLTGNTGDQADRGQFPFGWAIVEINPQADLPQLKAWCDAQAKHHPDMSAIRANHAAALAQAAQDKEQQRLERERLEAEEQARLQAEADRLAALAAMSYGRQQIERITEAVSKAPRVKQPGSDIAKQCFGVIDDALNDATRAQWSDAERAQLAEQISPLVKARDMLVGKDEKAFRALFRQLRGEL
jgi:CRISPR-associated protein Csm5